MRLKWIVAFAIALGIPVAAMAAFNSMLAPASADANRQLVVIKPGTGVIGISEQLEHQGVIKSGLAFSLWLRMHGADRSLKAGIYAVSPAMGSRKIADLLVSGKGEEGRLTIPEGFSLHQIGALLDEQQPGSGDRFVHFASSARLWSNEFKCVQGLPPGASLEGFLFPDTYVVAPGATREQDLIRMMLARFEQVALPVYEQSGRSLNLLQTVTLASIVEKEAVHPEERPLIAGVFFNRLAQHIPFGSDPTVEYALHKHQDARGLSLREVAIDSPYNTYKYAGLPPGPIANPGLASLQAVLAPAHTKFLYFVARGDGTHAFTSTYKDHLAAQRRILASRH